ncbi:hypothetical protein MK139_12215, partial [bacterium]|nr:hypothetical protein [bacterium]
ECARTSVRQTPRALEIVVIGFFIFHLTILKRFFVIKLEDPAAFAERRVVFAKSVAFGATLS